MADSVTAMRTAWPLASSRLFSTTRLSSPAIDPIVMFFVRRSLNKLAKTVGVNRKVGNVVRCVLCYAGQVGRVLVGNHSGA